MWDNLRYCFSICLNGQTKTFRQYWEAKFGFYTVLRCHVLCPCTSYRLHPQVLYLTVSSRVHIEKLIVPQLDKIIPAHHGAWTVFSFSKQPASCPYPEPLSLKPHDVILFLLRSILILIVVLPCILISTKLFCQQMYLLLKHKMLQFIFKISFLIWLLHVSVPSDHHHCHCTATILTVLTMCFN